MIDRLIDSSKLETSILFQTDPGPRQSARRWPKP